MFSLGSNAAPKVTGCVAPEKSFNLSKLSFLIRKVEIITLLTLQGVVFFLVEI